jgi:hypothetical protein
MSGKKYVTYEEFGAKGDGVTEDFAAIKAAHDYANEHGLPVKAKEGATYYIHDTRIDGVVKHIAIKTDVDFGNAEFIIDDRDMDGRPSASESMRKMSASNIFNVMPDVPNITLNDRELLDKIVSDGLRPGSKKINIGLGYPAMIIPFNNKYKVYRRCGYYSLAFGQVMHEVIVLDKDGNIDESTPIMFDYNYIDYIEVIRLDIKPITILGGKFTTRASRVNLVYRDENRNVTCYDIYIARGFAVCRSYTTVKGMKHYVTDEVTVKEQITDGVITHVSSSYAGFLVAMRANEVTFEDCIIQGRRAYTRPAGSLRGGTGGTYDFRANMINKIVVKNCVQSNFWINIDENDVITPAGEGDPGAVTSLYYLDRAGQKIKLHWGIGETDFCKNVQYIGSTMSRFDAHEGLYNGRIEGCTLNYISLTGKGDFSVENTRWFAEDPMLHSNALFHLRADYGCTWDGVIRGKGIKAYVYDSPAHLVYHGYMNWFCGYKTAMPSLDLEDIEFFNIETRKSLGIDKTVGIFSTNIAAEPRMHLENTLNKTAIFGYVDEDGDGLVDGTDIPYEHDRRLEFHRGVESESHVNVNPVTPPKFVRISVSNKTKYTVPDTANYMNVEGGGFFGKTEFISKNNKYIGTDHVGEKTETFEFVSIE